jgi:hypothetical protein
MPHAVTIVNDSDVSDTVSAMVSFDGPQPLRNSHSCR